MPLLDDIKKQVAQELSQVGSVSESFARELARVLDETNGRTRSIIRTLEASDGRLVASQAALGRAVRLRVELEAVLESAGYGALVNAALSDPLDRLTATALRGRRIINQAATLTPLDLDILQTWETVHRADLLGVGQRHVEGLWRTVVGGMLSNRDTDGLVDEVGNLVDVTLPQARTLYDTAVSSHVRQVHQLGIRPSDSDRFIYQGPNDTETRPFCAGLVNEVMTRAEVDDLDNGQLPNSLLSGGGYNCRHIWFFLGDASL